MKRLIIYTIATLLCWSCQDDNLTPQKTNPVISNITITVINESTAKCTFTVNPVGATQKAGVTYSTDPAARPNDISTVNVSGGNITLELNNLIPNALYYYQVYILDINDSKIDSDIERFITNTSPDVSVSNMFGNGIVASEYFGGGSGSLLSPYLIENAQQLKKLVDDVKAGARYFSTLFKLTTDIYVTADEWIPIGYANFDGDYFWRPFTANFDGGGHTISGTLKSDKYGEFGFFGRIEEGNVSNLTIAADIINECQSYWTYTGGIVGLYRFNSTIQNCHVIGSVTGGNADNRYSNTTGGIAGEIVGCTILDCVVSGNVVDRNLYDNSVLGGIAGWSGNADNTDLHGISKIINCTNQGTVTGQGVAGGIVGLNGGEIHTSLNSGNISGDTNYTGGLVGSGGYFDLGNIYSCCTNSGTVNGQKANINNQIGSGKAVEPCPDGHAKR